MLLSPFDDGDAEVSIFNLSVDLGNLKMDSDFSAVGIAVRIG